MTQQQHIRHAHWVAGICAGLVAIGAVLILFGWWANQPGFTQIFPVGDAAMRPNSAIAYLLCAIAVLAYVLGLTRWITVAASAVVLLIGCINAIEHMTATNWTGFDLLVTPNWAVLPTSPHPGRLGPTATFAVICLGFGGILLGLRRMPNLRPVLASVVGVLGLVGLFAHALGVGRSEGFIVGFATRASLDTAAAITLLSIAILTAGIEFGWTRVQISEQTGGRASRVLVPGILLVVFVTTVAVKVSLLDAGADPRLAMLVGISIVTAWVLAFSVYLTTRVNLLDEEREANLAEVNRRVMRSEHLQRLTAELSIVASTGGDLAALTCARAVAAMDAATVGAYLRIATTPDGQRDRLILGSISGVDRGAETAIRDLLQEPVSVESNLTRDVIRTGHPRLYSDLRSEGALAVSPSYRQFIDPVGATALLLARVDVDGQPEGLLLLLSTGPVQLSRDEESFTAELARVLGLAMTAGRFYEALQSSNRQLEQRVIQRTAQLERARVELEAVLQSAADAIYTINTDGVITRANPAAERMLGFPPGGLIGVVVYTLLPAEDRDDAAKLLARAATRGARAAFGEGGQIEGAMVRRDGTRIVVQTTAGEIPGADDQTAGLFTLITRDVTDQVRDQKRLRTLEKQFRAAFDNAPIGMALTALDGRWIRVNRALGEIVGFSDDQLLTMDFREITYPEDRAEDLRLMQQLVSGEIASYTREKRYVHRDGRLVWVHLSVSLVRDDDGAPLFYIAQMEDITERRELLDQLNRTNEDLRRFAYVASHDLQAPLRTIGGFTEVLIASLNAETLTAEQRTMAEYITTGVVRMQLLIRDLLSYGRIDAEELSRDPIDLAEVFAEAVENLASDISESGATVTIDGDTVIAGNRGQIRQVLQNLISNAIVHAVPDRPAVIRVETHPLPDGMVEVAVSDNGPGIPVEHQQRIFDMFKQLKRSEGTGIGLAIVKRIVERHGGTVQVDSNGRSGTVIRLTLPAWAAASQS